MAVAPIVNNLKNHPQFYVFDPQNHKYVRFFEKGRVFFEKKRAPARQTPGVVSELVFTKNPKSHQIDFWIGRIEATHPIKPPATLFIHFDVFLLFFWKNTKIY